MRCAGMKLDHSGLALYVYQRDRRRYESLIASISALLKKFHAGASNGLAQRAVRPPLRPLRPTCLTNECGLAPSLGSPLPTA